MRYIQKRWCNTLSLSLVSLTALVLTGCAFSAVKKPAPNKYAASFMQEQAFIVESAKALEDAKVSLLAMGYEIQAVTPELNQVLSKTKSIPLQGACDCGTWNSSAVTGTAESAIRVRINNNVAGQSTVAIEHSCGVTFTGRNLYGGVTHQETYRCASVGTVEKQFWTTFSSVLKAQTAEK